MQIGGHGEAGGRGGECHVVVSAELAASVAAVATSEPRLGAERARCARHYTTWWPDVATLGRCSVNKTDDSRLTLLTPVPPHRAVYMCGIILALVSGVLVAYAMVVQRYALTQPDQCGGRQRFWGRDVRPFFVWCVGMIIYGIGSGGTYSVAGLLIPLSLLSALFVTLLVANLFIAKALLGEIPTPAKKAGAAVVLFGATLASVGAPTDAPTEYTSAEVADLFGRTAGAAWFISMGVVVVSSVLAMCIFEARYPTRDLAESKERLAKISPGDPQPDLSDLQLAPGWLEKLMALVYPGSLGLDEAIVHVCLRAGNAMSTTCSRGGCDHWIYPWTLGMWLCTAMATLWWLRVVFKRYETTVALPVEYGAMTAADVVSGLVFFKETDHMDTWQVTLVICGIVTCLIGIQVGRMGLDVTAAASAGAATSTSATRSARVVAEGTSEARAASPPSGLAA